MNKINNNKIVFALGILAILAFGTSVSPEPVSAGTAGYVTPYDSSNYSSNRYNTYQTPSNYDNIEPTYVAPAYTPAPTYTAPSPTPTVYSNSTNPNRTTTTRTATRTTTPATQTTANQNTTYTNSNADSATNTETNGDLGANAIFGSDGFLPSSIIQWIMFAILVLLIVILVRKIHGGGERYHAMPMKHD
ncbi:MAG: hypothetical protein V4699_02570 [Patescibacteria group bacterium]